MLTVQDDARPIPTQAATFDATAPAGITTVTATPARPTRLGVRLAGVPRRQRDRAAGARFGRQRGDPVGHPAGLERPGLLEMLGLEVEAVVTEAGTGRRLDPRGRRRRRQQRRPGDPTRQPLPGRREFVERHQVVGRLGHRREYAGG